jgi:hypothetical protein
MSRITVARDSPDDLTDRQIYVSVDGEQIGVLLYGQSVTRDVEPGPHYARAHNTLFWKTIDFTLAPDEHASFIVVNRAGPGTYVMLSLLGTGPIYLRFERTDQKAAS